MANNQKIFKCTVMIEPAKEGGYIAYVPLLPGCATQGETFEEVKLMIIDAIKGYLEVLKENWFSGTPANRLAFNFQAPGNQKNNNSANAS